MPCQGECVVPSDCRAAAAAIPPFTPKSWLVSKAISDPSWFTLELPMLWGLVTVGKPRPGSAEPPSGGPACFPVRASIVRESSPAELRAPGSTTVTSRAWSPCPQYLSSTTSLQRVKSSSESTTTSSPLSV